MTDLEIKINFRAPSADALPPCNVPLGDVEFNAMVTFLKLLQSRYDDKEITLTNFPVCEPDPKASPSPLLVKAEIDKYCLLLAPRLTNVAERSFLKAIYLVVNYINGSFMPRDVQAKFVSACKQEGHADKCEITRIALHIKNFIGLYSLQFCRPLADLSYLLEAKLFNSDDLIAGVKLGAGILGGISNNCACGITKIPGNAFCGKCGARW